MIDRISFLHSINPGSLSTADLVVRYLDQFMLLYDLVDEQDNVSVIDNSTNYISYQIQNQDPNYIRALGDQLMNMQPVQLYANPLITKVNNQDSQSLNITIYKNK